jgi:peptidoglycan/xylan/chitin deacetylase (PgdA/CDA1 family)
MQQMSTRFRLPNFALCATALMACVSETGSQQPSIGSTSQAASATYAEIEFDKPGWLATNVIALTFDDGPDLTNTPIVLDTLKSKGVKATFFINTENAATVNVDTSTAAQAIVQRIVNEGHVLGNHTVHHEHLPQDTAARIQSEISGVQTTVNTIFGASAPHMTLFRAPFGEPYQTRDATGLALVAPLVTPTYVHVGWAVDTFDYNCTEGDTACVVSSFESKVGTVGNGGYGAILMHSIHSQTASALPTLIDYCTSHGFVFKTIEDLVNIKYGMSSAAVVSCGSAAPPLYAKGSCNTYAAGTQAKFNGHIWTCSNGNCANCSVDDRCAPGGTGCPWGTVWTDNGAATCGGSCTAETNAQFCSRLGKNCGSVTANDNCGTSRTVSSCGTCTSPATCGGGGTANVCGSCTAETNAQFCSRLGKNCGSVTANDNCGTSRTVSSCGTCTSPQTCGGGGTANVCGASCTAETNAQFCSRLGKNCGSVTANDNCGTSRTVSSCGTCTSPATCGGGGTANVCGSCTAETNAQFCTRLAKNCGSVTANDNCGTSRTVSSCGTCTSPQTCGGGGTANVCGGGGSSACATAYAQGNCLSYVSGTKVSSNGHNWTCSNGNCANCASTSSCAPGGTGCPWGVVWTDNGACQ